MTEARKVEDHFISYIEIIEKYKVTSSVNNSCFLETLTDFSIKF